ncbi:thioesterase II family protein [Streptomyces sp. MMS24-I2-30]|uniref:thioesterase II family protein n=1 Tax=Streptomyces sp. MMS24-I2-30 TaxID=3351564 RepID=UPI003896B956
MRPTDETQTSDFGTVRRLRGAAQRPKLVCFHHAGAGSSSFSAWQKTIGDSADVILVTLPGRDERSKEQRITNPDRLVTDLEAQLGDTLNSHPYILYGHSLGGLVAYHYARAREGAGLPGPELVAVAAAQPPHLDSPLVAGIELPDLELLQLLVSHGTLPPEAAQGGPVWQKWVLPVIRDDLRLAHAICTAERTALRAPMLAMAARQDTIAPLHAVSHWVDYAPAGFTLRAVTGDHFFNRNAKTPQIIREVAMRMYTGRIPVEYHPLAAWREAS